MSDRLWTLSSWALRVSAPYAVSPAGYRGPAAWLISRKITARIRLLCLTVFGLQVFQHPQGGEGTGETQDSQALTTRDRTGLELLITNMGSQVTVCRDVAGEGLSRS